MKPFRYIVFLLLLIVGGVSCKKNFLDVTPVDRFSDETVWSDPALVQTFVNNVYLGIQFPFSTVMISSSVDESMLVQDWETSNVTKSLITPSDMAAWGSNFWTGHPRNMVWEPTYKNIRACNLFFEKIEKVVFDDQAKKEQLIAEVRFLRAYFYQQLVALYGGVPLITKAYSLTDDFSVPRNTYEECINFIVQECDLAADKLPLNGDKARATKGAALSLKARTLLYAASDLHNDLSWTGSYGKKELIGYTGGDRTARWTAAKNAAKAVMDLNIYKLYKENPSSPAEATKNYGDIFLNNGSEEDIFLQFNDNLHNGSWDAPNPGLFNGPNGWHNWGGSTPIGQLVDAYEMSDGTKFSWSNPAHAANPYSNREPRFYASILYEGAQWRPRPVDVRSADPVGIVQVGTYTKPDGSKVPGLDTRKSPIEDWNGGYSGYYLRKFIDPTIDHQYFKQQWPFRRFRYAEILLNYAEACIALGQDGEARTYINKIRSRAGMPDVTESGQALVERYRNERKIELAYEEHRFYDVRRWMIAPSAYTDAGGVSVTGSMAADGTISNRVYAPITVQTRTWNPRFYLLPIRLDEINRNSKLVQNPLY